MAAEAEGIRRYPERFTILTHIGRTVIERKWKKTKHCFRRRHESEVDM